MTVRVLRETEHIGYRDSYIREDLLGEWAHRIMEAEKSHDFMIGHERPSASWRPGKPVAWLSPGTAHVLRLGLSHTNWLP